MKKIGRPRKLPLEVEAEKFMAERGTDAATKRDIYVAAALTALIAKSNAPPEHILREAEAWADFVLNDN